MQHPHTSAEILKMLMKMGVDVRKESERGALIMRDIGETYLPDGKFDPTEMSALLADSVTKATNAGFTGFRATSDMSWALEDKPGSHLLLPYEESMEKFYAQNAALGMCQYNAKQFPAPILREAMLFHGTTFLEDDTSPNHYRIRLRKQHLFADIYKAKGPNVYYHYIVQQDSSPDVISWGQTADLSSAKNEAMAVLQDRHGAPGAVEKESSK